MNLVEGMWLLVLGVAGLASFGLRNTTSAWRFLLYLVQLSLGGHAVVLGCWNTFASLFSSSDWIRNAPLLWLRYAVNGVVELALGLALLAGMLLAVTSEGKGADSWSGRRRKVAVAQAGLGALAIALVVWIVVFRLLSPW
jgi:hypothetical protein